MKLAVLLLLLVGCSSAQFAPSILRQTYPQRTPQEAIELFRSSSPTKKYIEIGAANACCGDTNGMVNLLRKKASENGGDALMDLEISAQGGAAATVIRYE